MVRRPLLQGAVFFVLPILIVDYINAVSGVICGILLFVVYKKSHELNFKKLMCLCLVFYVISLGNYMIQGNIPDPLAEQEGETTTLTGFVLKTQIKKPDTDNEHVTFIMKQDKWGHSKVLVNCYDTQIELLPGDYVSVTGSITNPQGRRNPNCFDYAKYLKSQRILHTVSADNTEILAKGHGLRTRLYVVRQRYINRVEKRTNKATAAFVNGILFGDKSEMDQDVIETFQRNGTAHILAVSGLHIGIIFGFISKLWPWRKRTGFLMFNSVFFFLYCMMASFAPSVVRATIMVLLSCIAKMNNRKYDLSSSAFAVIILMVLINPFTVYNTGFQMSFLAVISMALIMPYVRRVHEGALTGSTAVQLGLTPFVIYNFNYLPLGALLINIPIIYLAGLIVPLGLVAMFIPGLEWCLELIIRLLLTFNEVSCIDGITTFRMCSPPRFVMCFIYLFMLIFMSEQGRIFWGRHKSKLIKITGFMTIIIVSLIFGLCTRTGFENTNVTFVDVGQGDCVHISTEDGRNYLFDGGGNENYEVGKQVLKPYLLKNGVRHLDGAFVTHLHTDHYRGIVELCREGMIDGLWIYEGNMVFEEEILRSTGLDRNQIHYVSMGNQLKLDKDVAVKVLWPEKLTSRRYQMEIDEDSDENEISLILNVNVQGINVLITGDVDSQCEENMINTWRNKCVTNVLKVAHHGSKYSWSENFIRAVKPQIAVIQVGKNNYGHPTREVLEGLEEQGIKVYRNDQMGAIGLVIKRNCIKRTVAVIS